MHAGWNIVSVSRRIKKYRYGKKKFIFEDERIGGTGWNSSPYFLYETEANYVIMYRTQVLEKR